MIDLRKMGRGQRLQFLLKDTALYGLGGALNKALALVTFPLLARHFSVTDFGVIDLLNTMLVLLVTILVFGFDSAVARFFYEREDKDYRRQVVSQALALQLSILALVVPLLWLGAKPLADAFGLPAGGETIIELIVLQSPFFVLVNFSQGLLKWTFKRWHFLVISIGSSVVTMIGLLAGVIFFDLSLAGVFAIYLATRAAFGLLGLWFVRDWLAVPADTSRIKDMLPFAAPFGIICIISAFLPFLERGLVQYLLGGHELGLYAAGAKIASLVSLPIGAFEIAWGPFALALSKEHDAAQSYRSVLTVFAVGMFAMVLVLTAIAEPLVQLLGSQRYEGAGLVVFTLAMALAVQSIGGITDIGIVLSKKSYLKLYGYAAMLVVAGLAIPLLASLFGLIGVAWGSLAAQMSKVVTEANLAQRAHPLEWSYAGPLAAAAMALAAGILHQLTFGHFLAAGISLIPMLAIPAMAAMMWIYFINPDAKERILGGLKRRAA